MFEHVIYGVLAFFLLIIIMLMIMILWQKRKHVKKARHTKRIRTYVFKKYFDGENIEIPTSKKKLLEALIEIDEQIHMDETVRKRIIADITDIKFLKRMKHQLNAFRSYQRKMAAFYLGRLRTKDAYSALFERFKKEKNEAVKLRLISQLRYGLEPHMIDPIVLSLKGSSSRYHERLCVLLGDNYKRIYPYFPSYEQEEDYDIVLGLISMARFHADAFLTSYMINTLQSLTVSSPYTKAQTDLLMNNILKNLLKHTPELLTSKPYLTHEDERIKHYAILALSNMHDKSVLKILIEGFDKSPLDETRVEALSELVYQKRSHLDYLLKRFNALTTYQQTKLSDVFAYRIDYILLKYETIDDNIIKQILKNMVTKNMVEPLIEFLNHNHDITLQSFIVQHLKPALEENNTMKVHFQRHLNSSVLTAFDYQPLPILEKPKETPPFEPKKIRWLLKWLTLNLLLFPTIFVIRHGNELLSIDITVILQTFIVDVNIYLIFYFSIINVIYVLLLFFAFKGSKKHINLAATRKYSLLFTDHLLPGISVIAPAYNEEANIIESVTSLLNLKYPSSDVVVVNDGSKDQTLTTLIEHFELERKHMNINQHIGTKPVRGIYTTKDIPNLIVVDKVNGGKADALNVGINVSQKSYVCGIDADSVLEGDALLKLTSVMLDDTKPFVALGGNIYPANGFQFDHGKVIKRGLPKETLCRFQTIEYMRAFTSGRIGWSELRSLLIISGAFGLFEKESLIRTGGYLTSSSVHHKDTVGEDMELVVRLTLEALKRKEPYRVAYVYNAYCYTELPSDAGTLLKQRNRWQRGLIDILSYHRRMGFNPTYKQVGLLGYPYYFIFEFMGPFFEAQGYLMLLLALVLGLLSPLIILGIFTVSIVFGVVISLASLYMSEKEVLMLNKKETALIMLFAVLENFGYRQMISLHRVSSTIKAIRETGQWGSQKRKGFQKTTTQ